MAKDLCLLELVKSQEENACQTCASSVFYLAVSPAGWISSVLELLTVFIDQGVCRYFRRIQVLLKAVF